MTSKVKGTEGIEFPDSTVQGSAGISQAAADARYVNLTGDTMTGSLRVGGTGLTFPDATVQGSAAYSKAHMDKRKILVRATKNNIIVPPTNYTPLTFIWNVEQYDPDGLYNPLNGHFYLPEAGLYLFSGQFRVDNGNAVSDFSGGMAHVSGAAIVVAGQSINAAMDPNLRVHQTFNQIVQAAGPVYVGFITSGGTPMTFSGDNDVWDRIALTRIA